MSIDYLVVLPTAPLGCNHLKVRDNNLALSSRSMQYQLLDHWFKGMIDDAFIWYLIADFVSTGPLHE